MGLASVRVSTFDARFWSVQYRNGSLWAAHHVGNTRVRAQQLRQTGHDTFHAQQAFITTSELFHRNHLTAPDKRIHVDEPDLTLGSASLPQDGNTGRSDLSYNRLILQMGG